MIRIIPASAFQDNYIWIIHNNEYAAVIDPGQAQPVIDVLNTLNLRLSSILITHYHADHIGGVKALLAHQPTPVFAPKKEKVALVTHELEDGEMVSSKHALMDFQIIAIPGHTLGHIAYYCPGHLFCGDTLFSGGCGRVFEGTMEQMYLSLGRLAMLPDETKVYCAHEYTQANLKFALTVEPLNQASKDHLSNLQKSNEPSLPSTMGLEKKINPFLRCEHPNVIKAAEKFAGQRLSHPIAVFTTLRQWKDNF